PTIPRLVMTHSVPFPRNPQPVRARTARGKLPATDGSGRLLDTRRERAGWGHTLATQTSNRGLRRPPRRGVGGRLRPLLAWSVTARLSTGNLWWPKGFPPPGGSAREQATAPRALGRPHRRRAWQGPPFQSPSWRRAPRRVAAWTAR